MKALTGQQFDESCEVKDSRMTFRDADRDFGFKHRLFDKHPSDNPSPRRRRTKTIITKLTFSSVHFLSSSLICSSLHSCVETSMEFSDDKPYGQHRKWRTKTVKLQENV